jgi:serum/glucocorticoid-regulated kinase 2
MVEPDDTLALKNNTTIKEKIGEEKIYFSYKVQKSSRGSISIFDRNQDRIIMITNNAFYLLDGTEIKRRIKLEDLYGITVSKLSNQFIIHGRLNEYDYLFISPDKKKIIKALQSSYKAKEGKDLSFCLKSEKDIYKYVIQKKEASKNPYIKRINEAELSSRIY